MSKNKESNKMPETEQTPVEVKTTKTCPKCGQTLPISNFPQDKHRKDGLYIYCRACESIRQKAKNAVKAQQKLENEGYPVLIIETNEEKGTLTEIIFEEEPITV